ncbi:MAG: hypothetical protein IPK79_08710 [Vampirovibrionales bacterium]|nr:hypothetical protein [Vampirovibrionales bacterium]
MLRRVDGRSLPEYALILALVGLAAIPATAVLSGSMGDLFHYSDVSKANALFSLLDARPQGAAPAGVPMMTQSSVLKSAASSVSAPSAGSVSLATDASGRIVVKLQGLSSADTQDSTGAQGGDVVLTRLMADQILNLADELDAQGGDSAISARLRQVATNAHNLGLTQGAINTARVNDDRQALTLNFAGSEASKIPLLADPITGVKPSPGGSLPLVFYNLQDATNASYNSLASDIDKSADPKVKALKSRLQNYVGAVDTVATRNYQQQSIFYVASGEDNTLSPKAIKYKGATIPTAINTSGVTIDLAPRFTHATADRIATSDRETGTTPPTVVDGVYQDGALPNN